MSPPAREEHDHRIKTDEQSQHAQECVADQAEPCRPISRSRCVTHQAEPNMSLLQIL
jgi:hypothetical protein